MKKELSWHTFRCQENIIASNYSPQYEMKQSESCKKGIEIDRKARLIFNASYILG